jgi:hypothetical protein
VDLTANIFEREGHNSDSAAFPKGSYRPEQGQFVDSNSRYVAIPRAA